MRNLKNTFLGLCTLILISGCGGYNRGITTSPEASLNDRFEREVGNDRIYFPFNSSEITAEAKENLKKQAEWLKDNSSVKVTIEGHCDPRGTREYNLALGERRANSVRKALINIGISSDRVSTISYGKERPAVLGTTERDYALNRRGVTVLSYN